MTAPDLSAFHRALPVRLLTVTAHDVARGVYRRVYSSNRIAYPVPGTKPMTDAAWIEASDGGARTFVANTDAAFDAWFPDAALIRSLGCRSAATIPVIGTDGTVAGTVNLLHDAGWFTPARVAGYEAEVVRWTPQLLSAMA